MQIDLLSDILDLMHIRGGVFGRLNAGDSWATSLQSDDAIKFCAATQGSCWYHVKGLPAPVLFSAGDVLVVNSADPLLMGHAPAALPDAADPCPEPDTDGSYQYGRGVVFSMLSGGVQVDAEHRDLLRRSLPPLMHVLHDMDKAGPLANLVRQLVTEMQPQGQPGQSTAVSALTQLLFVQILRTYMEFATEENAGWLRVFGDSRLTAALNSIHSAPASKWTLDELARTAGMSRTAFAVGFREVMGVPPITYLTNWRMQLAKRTLANGASVSEAAAEVGYRSESAFSEAFRRWSGTAPGTFRKACKSGSLKSAAPSSLVQD